MAKRRFETADEYVASFEGDARELLSSLRECIRETAPAAREEIKWSQPAYTQGGILVAFAGFRAHANFYATPSTISAFPRSSSLTRPARAPSSCPTVTEFRSS